MTKAKFSLLGYLVDDNSTSPSLVAGLLWRREVAAGRRSVLRELKVGSGWARHRGWDKVLFPYCSSIPVASSL